MGEPVRCSCGAVLLEAVTDTGVKPVGADEAIVFRRKTDFVICPECLTTYSAYLLLTGASLDEARIDKARG